MEWLLTQTDVVYIMYEKFQNFKQFQTKSFLPLIVKRRGKSRIGRGDKKNPYLMFLSNYLI